MKKAYVLNDTSDKMGTSFLYGNFERQHSMLKKAGLPNDVRSVTDVDMVLIHREMGKLEYFVYLSEFPEDRLYIFKDRAWLGDLI